jgi:hypothetical protein
VLDGEADAAEPLGTSAVWLTFSSYPSTKNKKSCVINEFYALLLTILIIAFREGGYNNRSNAPDAERHPDRAPRGEFGSSQFDGHCRH